tara:strand:- start:2731 stop:3474 length:744 start_codon:yes stop_codon:yes gene_type:complete
MIIISGASDNHSKSLIQFIQSVINHNDTNIILVIYDLGLNKENKNKINLLHEKENIKMIIKTFDYSKYPDYFNIKINAGQYAWKPVIIKECFDTICNLYEDNILLWMDAGNMITGSIKKLETLIKNNNIYSPITSGGILKNRHTDVDKGWVHHKTYNLIGNNIRQNYNMRAGGTIGFNCNNCWVIELISKFSEYACNKDIIAPEGSNRLNHRQDLSILTILFYQYKEKYNFKVEDSIINHTFHNDIG